jgi:hypothetical protein
MKLLILLICTLFAWVKSQGNTLVLLDNQVIRETHSIFFKSLQGKTFSKSEVMLPANFSRAGLHS